ncbi:rac GTPase-activating protein 1-like [Seriola dumerili]|uniref:Rac GTPase-activating protein 1 n=1 Tax=Seriola dumerili TaxID=41447 RepID=A0A3B4VQ60_SERDU|nr:rac GTPase-activating protein 1-like [Seriola dumerili]XP_022600972.1 rac GTPase-activating protein 1-like [Seriola dumerili]
MESPVLNLYNQFQSLRAQVDGLNEGIEPQFLQMALNFEECRKKWLRAGDELVSCKEMLAKAETERGALEVKLKHARNQVDVEIRRRQKAETVYEKLERQLQLIRELLISENNSVHLSEEQRSALAFLSAHSQAAQAANGNLNSSRRLTTIDESASLLSDISFDQTDDSLDWDSSVMKTVRLRKRQKRRSSRKLCEVPPQAMKKPRSTGRTSERMNESIVAKTTITVPVNGGAVEAVSTIETVPYWTRSRKRSVAPAWGDTTTTDQSETASEAPSTPVSDFQAQLRTPKANGGGKKHHFIPKTVIKSEFCAPCGRRTKFGKMYLRCQDCRIVTHPECRERCPLPCNPAAVSTPIKNTEATLADFAPVTSPKIPALVIYCIKEIEHRGLHEVGLYRVSGHDRVVKELKEKLIRGKTLPALNKVEDINVITGVLKDFLRNLPEPLLTFHLNKAFMAAAEIQDDDNSLAMMYQTIGELPQPNRDTLACLMIHLQKVSQSVDTKMDVNNLARVFGPTLVGHAVPDPDPMTILHDTNRQPKVVERLLSIPASYWSQFAHPDNTAMDNAHQFDTLDHRVSILGPVTTPEHQMMTKTPSSSSLSQRMMQTLSSTTIFGSKSKATAASNRQGNFFASPQLK